jgi:hypothetical protein
MHSQGAGLDRMEPIFARMHLQILGGYSRMVAGSSLFYKIEEEVQCTVVEEAVCCKVGDYVGDLGALQQRDVV